MLCIQFMHNQLLTTMERVTDSGYVNLNELEVGGWLRVAWHWSWKDC